MIKKELYIIDPVYEDHQMISGVLRHDEKSFRIEFPELGMGAGYPINMKNDKIAKKAKGLINKKVAIGAIFQTQDFGEIRVTKVVADWIVDLKKDQ